MNTNICAICRHYPSRRILALVQVWKGGCGYLRLRVVCPVCAENSPKVKGVQHTLPGVR